MGIRKSSVKNRKAGVSGDGVAIRLPNNATVRSARRHIPLYVGICAQPYCGQHRWAGRHKTSDRPRKQKPRVSGALTGATEGLGGEGGPLSLEQQQRRDLVPIENGNSGVRGVPAIPQRRSPRTPPSPGPHRYVVNIRLGRWQNKVSHHNHSRNGPRTHTV